ncbi:SDR family oxidoreductase [uncultured Friedmanniella sp.]|uniref:SDR family oxidoreductase n=1 Tax=uncultured Friedmanniella sp. TaxID=335381 RepID=UPI0035CBB756
MSMPSLAITGVTGHVGGLVARQLAAAGVPLRLLARSPERAPDLPGCPVAELSYGDTDQAQQALAGVEVLLMVSAAENANRRTQHLGLIDAAAAAGVQHVVYTSFVAAGPESTFTLGRDHGATEQHLETSGMDATILRDSFYLDFLPDTVGEDGVIRGPAGHGRLAAVARADVARCAAAVLRDPARHRGRHYDLTGPEALSLADVARVLTEVTGRPTTYHDETVPEAYASRASYGAPDWQLDAWVSTYTAIAEGSLAAVSDDVRRLTGRSPLSLREVLVGRP